MQSGKFVEGLSNHARLLAKLEEIQHRGAAEASWLMVVGEPGYGKSKTLTAIAMKRNALMIRAKTDMNTLWLLNELAEMLGISRQRTKQAQFQSVCAELLNKQPIIIIDEIDHVARKLTCLETLRDLTDLTECPLIASGTRAALETIKAYKQLHSRVFDVLVWAPASVADVAKIADALINVQIDQPLLQHILKRTDGRLRTVMNALARVEAFGNKNRVKLVKLEDFGVNRQLTNDETLRPQPLLVAANG